MHDVFFFDGNAVLRKGIEITLQPFFGDGKMFVARQVGDVAVAATHQMVDNLKCPFAVVDNHLCGVELRKHTIDKHNWCSFANNSVVEVCVLGIFGN